MGDWRNYMLNGTNVYGNTWVSAWLKYLQTTEPSAFLILSNEMINR